jgi:DNA-binding response OmpR family regulator
MPDTSNTSNEVPAKKKILLIEDEHAIRVMYAQVLEEAGYEVIHLSDGDEAIEAILKGDWSLVLLDIMLPRKDGMQVLKELKGHPNWKKGPVVLLSNLNSEEIINNAYGLGADGYLIKSEIKPDKVVAEVEEFLGV